ncbi:hypothetical protein Tco_0610935 [Tanacetum coccineum]
MRANSHHRPLLVAAVALQRGVATAAAVGPAQARSYYLGNNISGPAFMVISGSLRIHIEQRIAAMMGYRGGSGG